MSRGSNTWRRGPLCLWFALLPGMAQHESAAQEQETHTVAEIQVDLASAGAEISPLLFGHFTEMTLTSFEGGVSNEWLFNRKFGIDESGETDKLIVLRSGTGAGWTPLTQDTAVTLALDKNVHFSAPFAQRLTLLDAAAGPAGVWQSGFQPVLKHLTPLKRVPYPFRFKAGTTYRVRLAIRQGNDPVSVHVGLGTAADALAAETTIAPQGRDWVVVERLLTPMRTVEDGRFLVCIREPGTVWIDSLSLTEDGKDDGGFRKDVIELTNQIMPTILRWPGGCFADDYDWRDGIGPVDRRPVTYNRAWKSFTPNDVGTDEFIHLCRRLRAEPYLCVNYGTGTAEQAAAWVEYCNGAASTPGGRLRTQHGHPEPFNVRYWNVGNEIYLPNEFGSTSGRDYGRGFRRFAEAMRAVDPGIRLVAVGCFDLAAEEAARAQRDPEQWQLLRYFHDWTRGLMEEAGDQVDLISIHFYDPGGVEKAQSREHVNQLCMAPALALEERLDRLQELVRSLAPAGKHIPIALDEWATWAQNESNLTEIEVSKEADPAGIGLDGSLEMLRSALGEATIMNLMQRRPADFALANKTLLYAYAVGEIGIRRDALHVSPCGLMMQLYATRERCRAVEVRTVCDSFKVEPLRPHDATRHVPELDASARIFENGEAELFVVNRNLEAPVSCRIALRGVAGNSVEVAVLTADSVLARNAFARPDRVRIETSSIPLESDAVLLHTFPKHSLTRLRFKTGVAPAPQTPK
ncbi:MAG: hypothetical protein HYV27_22075 [Candidatus Hydrogenedentes bacterium]|nr:hypothetical protein [Candidatus Hydrogenedentota bacterium]